MASYDHFIWQQPTNHENEQSVHTQTSPHNQVQISEKALAI